MAEQLAACARQLFEGASGSNEQRVANAWIMQFQRSAEAWQAALQLLETPVRDPLTHQTLAGPELVAIQILRLKTQQEWTNISSQHQQVVRQTLLKLLEVACMTDSGLSPVSRRIACVTLADIVVKSYKTWTGWKNDVQRLVDAGVAAQRQHKGAAVLTEILGAIPLQILASERMCTAEEMNEMLTIFQAEGDDVMTAAQMVLTNMPDEGSIALRCLEGWVVGCVPTHEAFGLTAAHLFARGLLDVLFAAVINGNEEQAQMAAGIIADSFVSAPVSENMINAVLHSARRLVEAMAVFQSEVRSPTGEIITREQHGMPRHFKDRVLFSDESRPRIACSLAMNHAPILLWNQVSGIQTDQQSSSSMQFLELLLACSSYDDIDVVQPTLEIWFFFLEENSSQSEASWQLLNAPGKEHVVSVLSRLVNALIERCKYPQWLVDKQQLVSDDPEIEAISDLRREVADTMLSLFSKWPGGRGKPTGDYASCVKGMCQMLVESKDIALIDALLFLLSYMVELFDAVSSDSESEDDPEAFQDPESGGIDVLLGVLDCALSLPIHPLVINGVARYLRSLSTSLALPASVYLRASMIICQGLQYMSSFPVAVQSLLHHSSSITKYTTVDERAPLLRALLTFCSTLQTQTTPESEGDLLEVTFRIASGVSDEDFGGLCSTVLSNITIRVQSGHPMEVSSSVYMLGRALGGVQDQKHGFALVDLLWSIVSASLLQHKGDESCRRAGAQFFLNVIPHLQKEACIRSRLKYWTCTFERLLAGFRSKLHDARGTDDELSMESFLLQHHEAHKMIPEVEQFMKMAREVLSSFPQVLTKDCSNGEPTLFWVCLDLATRLLKVDHQIQEMCDAACDFLLDAMRCQPEPILERIHIFASEIVRVVLSFLGLRRQHYRVRNLWDFLFQCVHGPQMSTQIRGGFLVAVSTVVIEECALHPLLPAQVYQQMPGELRMRRQRHHFRQYFTQLDRAVDAGNS
ncbi:hypothetical protein PInf_016406 [Phytophthora infestans]|nr:hypothetical protein PInf_016406 [Phytophthora infestans]